MFPFGLRKFKLRSRYIHTVINASLTFNVQRVDITKTGQNDDVYGEPVSGGAISGRIIERHYERYRTPRTIHI